MIKTSFEDMLKESRPKPTGSDRTLEPKALNKYLSSHMKKLEENDGFGLDSFNISSKLVLESRIFKTSRLQCMGKYKP